MGSQLNFNIKIKIVNNITYFRWKTNKGARLLNKRAFSGFKVFVKKNLFWHLDIFYDCQGLTATIFLRQNSDFITQFSLGGPGFKLTIFGTRQNVY